MLKPAVCNRELCVFAFSKLGVMKNAAEGFATQAEVRKNLLGKTWGNFKFRKKKQVVDFLLATAKAAALSQRRDLIFDPFPSVVDPDNPNALAFSPKHKDWDRLCKVLNCVSIRELASMQDDKQVTRNGQKIDRVTFPLVSCLPNAL